LRFINANAGQRWHAQRAMCFCEKGERSCYGASKTYSDTAFTPLTAISAPPTNFILTTCSGEFAITEAIQVKAEQGKIMLMGEVKSEKDNAEITATMQQTLGVREVNHQLRIS
jgi:hypothetical protein